jgi:hypothetical protein
LRLLDQERVLDGLEFKTVLARHVEQNGWSIAQSGASSRSTAMESVRPKPATSTYLGASRVAGERPLVGIRVELWEVEILQLQVANVVDVDLRNWPGERHGDAEREDSEETHFGGFR